MHTDGPLENKYFPRRTQRVRHTPPALAPAVINGDIRRSSRARKLMYSTFNQNMIDKELTMLRNEQLHDGQGPHRDKPAKGSKMVPGEAEGSSEEEVYSTHTHTHPDQL